MANNNSEESVEALFTSQLIDISNFEHRGTIEPADDAKIEVYAVPREKMVEAGDVVFIRGKVSPVLQFFRVIYSTTLRYPVMNCAMACSPLPCQLFIQTEPVPHGEIWEAFKTDVLNLDLLPY